MPDLTRSVPRLNQKALTQRQNRALRVLAYTKQLHPALIVCQLRREERRLQREFWAQPLVVDGKFGPTSGPALFVWDRLMKCREKILEIVCWPKPAALRPGQTPGQELNRAGRIDLALAPADAVEVPVSHPMDSPAPPSAPSSP